MDNKRVRKLTNLLRRGVVLVNGITEQYWHEKDELERK